MKLLWWDGQGLVLPAKLVEKTAGSIGWRSRAASRCSRPQPSMLFEGVDLLKAMIVAAGAELEQLRMQVARLRRMAFGRSSEKLTREADQLARGWRRA